MLENIPSCEAYLDHIVVYSSDWSTHMVTLREGFTSLEKASLMLNHAMCDFAKGSVLYLGQLVGLGKVHPAKISAIKKFPLPTSRKELRRFLGMTGYYLCFCKNLSSVAALLTDLTSPSKPFVWSEGCQQTFESLKGILSCTPVLSAPNSSLPFKLEIDVELGQEQCFSRRITMM